MVLTRQRTLSVLPSPASPSLGRAAGGPVLLSGCRPPLLPRAVPLASRGLLPLAALIAGSRTCRRPARSCAPTVEGELREEHACGTEGRRASEQRCVRGCVIRLWGKASE
eukprot:scaffold45696_cov27-Tisochrysis_lutea.AAC.2